jgi:hypothetical protein
MRRDRYGRLTPAASRQWQGYNGLIAQVEATTTPAGVGIPQDQASSSLAHLLRALEAAWAHLTGGRPQEFAAWLERTAVVGLGENTEPAFNYLDSLDSFLISAIQEVEDLRQRDLTPGEVEAELIAIWRRTYAFAAGHEEARLSRIWLARGRAIKERYPGTAFRRRIYKTSLSPRSATSLLDLTEAVRYRLREGARYAEWDVERRFTFIHDVLALLSQVPSFRITATLGRRTNFQDWPMVLRWWLAKVTLPTQPAPAQITAWYDFVAQNFIYRGAWGLGSIIGVLLDTADGGQPVRALEIDDWPRSGLPWVAFWLKELITWGTLDPVAAFLLARGDAVDRPQAEANARAYYDGVPGNADPNDVLDPREIRRWVAERTRPQEVIAIRDLAIDVALVRPVADYVRQRLAVSPLEWNDELIWINPAGYTVARSEKPFGWPAEPSSFEFELVVADSVITGRPYLRPPA